MAMILLLMFLIVPVHCKVGEDRTKVKIFSCVRPLLINSLQLWKGVYELLTGQNNKNENM